MKPLDILPARLALPVSSLALLIAGASLWACEGKFRMSCPGGTTQTAGGGDVDDACTPNEQLAGTGGAGDGGRAGSPGGANGAGAGSGQVPPAGVCQAGQKQCSAEGLSACGTDGRWQAPTACEISCDEAKLECVVPVQLAAGRRHACARLSDGTLRCWGNNLSFQLGTGESGNQSRPAPVAALTNVIDVAAAYENVCAITADESAFCWGSNAVNKISPTPGSVALPVAQGVSAAKQVAIGFQHVCISDEQNVIFCRGDSGWGQCGNNAYGLQLAAYSPVQNLSNVPRHLGLNTRTSLAVTDNQVVRCWGDVGTICPGLEGGDGPVNGLKDPTVVPAVTAALSLSVTDDVACTTRVDGRAMCWGRNDYGQAGQGVINDYVSGSVNAVPKVVLGLEGARQVSVSSHNVCAIKEDGGLVCWGSNRYNQLGSPCSKLSCQTAPDQDSYVATPVVVPIGEAVVEVKIGSQFACALTASAKVLCWGQNDIGQLGIGQTSPSESTPKPVVWR